MWESKTIDQVAGIRFDYVVTLCDSAGRGCPVFPGSTRVIHVGFADPPELARGAQTEEEALTHYRHVRDEIRSFVERLPQALEEGDG